MLRNQPRTVHITPIRQWANPRALILNIQGTIDHSCLENRSGAKYKIFTVTFLIFIIIIFHLDGFQLYDPAVISTIHVVLFMNCSPSTLLLKSTIVVFTFFWTFSFDTVVTHFVPGNLKTLKKRLFFPVLPYPLLWLSIFFVLNRESHLHVTF